MGRGGRREEGGKEEGRKEKGGEYGEGGGRKRKEHIHVYSNICDNYFSTPYSHCPRNADLPDGSLL